MSEFVIEKGVPIPNGRSRYPFKDMEVGDSVYIEGKASSKISGSFGILRPKRFIARNEKTGVRVWRVA